MDKKIGKPSIYLTPVGLGGVSLSLEPKKRICPIFLICPEGDYCWMGRPITTLWARVHCNAADGSGEITLVDVDDEINSVS